MAEGAYFVPIRRCCVDIVSRPPPPVLRPYSMEWQVGVVMRPPCAVGTTPFFRTDCSLGSWPKSISGARWPTNGSQSARGPGRAVWCPCWRSAVCSTTRWRATRISVHHVCRLRCSRMILSGAVSCPARSNPSGPRRCSRRWIAVWCPSWTCTLTRWTSMSPSWTTCCTCPLGSGWSWNKTVCLYYDAIVEVCYYILLTLYIIVRLSRVTRYTYAPGHMTRWPTCEILSYSMNVFVDRSRRKARPRPSMLAYSRWICSLPIWSLVSSRHGSLVSLRRDTIESII